jgi:hypothetical protein
MTSSGIPSRLPGSGVCPSVKFVRAIAPYTAKSRRARSTVRARGKTPEESA